MSKRLQDLIHAATAQGLLPPDTAPKELARPWPVILMTGLGAWLAAVPMLGVLFLIFGSALEKGALCYVFGAALLYGAIHVLRSRTVSPFIEQLGLPLLLVGGGLLAFGLFRDLPDMASEALLLLVIAAAAWMVPQHWLRSLLGALAAMMLILMSGVTLVALALWLVAVYVVDTHTPSGRSARKMILLETMSNGWILLTLAVLAYDSGATFLSPAALGHLRAAGDTAGTSHLLPKVISSALTIAGAAWLGRCWPTLRAPRYAAAAILAVMSWLIPGLGAALLVLAACAGSGRWRLAAASAVAASWIVGTFYYQLGVPLTTKAALMAAMGSAFGVIAWLSWSARAGDIIDMTASAAPADVARPAQRAGIVASLLLTLLVANGAIWQKEALISTGRPVFIELAPVDPRSLMQGDYMALNFQLTALDRNDRQTLRRAKVIAKIDGRGVAVMQGLAGDRALAPDEILIELVRTGNGLRPATDGWYFKEGEAARWSRAKYGEFRIDDKGRALLVNLRGPDLEPL